MVDIEINDLAIIFEPYITEEGIFCFKPVQVVEGNYDEESDRFIDTNLYSYSHLTKCEKSRGYAIRQSINKLSLQFPDKSLEEIKQILLEEHSKFNYFLGYYNEELFVFKNDEKTGENAFLLDEDTLEYILCLYDDDEIEKLMLDDSFKIEEEVNEKEEKVINPHLLYKQIKEIVKGQDNAIKQIVTTIWSNYDNKNIEKEEKTKTNNMILVGGSGTGKTEILRQISNRLGIPMLITGVAGMSQAGYVGTGTDEILSNLLTLTDGDVEKAEHAIVVLDEIDKIAFNEGKSGTVSTEGVQNELLKIVEDGTFYVKVNNGGLQSSKVIINTANITFIGAGAFNGILTTKKKKGLGFNQDINEKEESKEKITDSDLIKFGLKPELVGRMSKIVKLNELDENIFKDIVKNSKKSAYRSKVRFISRKGIKVIPVSEDEIIEEIAKLAVSKKIGARSIDGIVEEMFDDILYAISNPEEQYKELQITKETVTNPKKYVLRK